jgi:ATP-dependent Clp protease ATP-binding subunit ClpC
MLLDHLGKPIPSSNSEEEEDDFDITDLEEEDLFYPKTPLKHFSGLGKISKLCEFGQDWTVDAANGKFSPVYGREKEIGQISEILRRRIKRNPVLVGKSGVGKTAIIEALALKIISNEVPSWLKNKKIISISLFDIIAQDKNYSFGEYAQRLKNVVQELIHQPYDQDGWGRIAFFDEIHTLKEYEHGANFLKQHLARGEVQLIGATTLDEYRRYIERDPALERRFAPVFIDEPNTDDTIKILLGIKTKLEHEYHVSINESAIKLAVELSNYCIHDRYQPDKSIELIDRACVRVLSTTSIKSNPDLENPYKHVVQDHHVRSIVSEWTNIPDSSLSGERQIYLNLEENLKKSIVGQDEAIKEITRIIIANKAGTVAKPQRPNGVFLFIGSTGVGKTQLAKSLALSITGKQEHLVILDMTGYRENYSVASLIGVPQGNDSTPQLPFLTKLVRDHPFGVLLLDEIEKAHPEVLSLFMPVFEEGTLVDKQGNTIQFGNMTIVMTANSDPSEKANNELRRKKQDNNQPLKRNEEIIFWKGHYKKELFRAVKKDFKFSSEFLNRIDSIVPFYPLGKGHIKSILDIELSNMEKRLNIEFCLGEGVLEFLANESDKKEFGAREIRRTIDLFLGNKLAMMKMQYAPDDWSKISTVEISMSLDLNRLELYPTIQSKGLK